MKFKLLIIIFFLYSCSPHLSSSSQKKPYTAKGFAYIYNEPDVNEKIIKGKLNNNNTDFSTKSKNRNSY